MSEAANSHYGALERLSPALWRREVKAGGALYLHWCPACRHGHTYPVGVQNRPNWSFNGNAEKPSFSPSMHIFTPAGPYGEDGEMVPQRTLCHYFVTDGQILYQNDCHQGTPYIGQSLPLEPIPDDYGF